MDKLRDRFATLDRVPVPDTWSDVIRRAEALPAALDGRTRVALGGRPRHGARPRLGTSPLLAALATLVLVVTVAVGGLVVGSWLVDGPDPTVQPTIPPQAASPTAFAPAPSDAGTVGTPLCPGAVREGDVRPTYGDELGQSERAWDLDGPALRRGPVEAGSIAAFTDDLAERPLSVVLVDTSTGDLCRIVDFETADERAYRGLNWSPAGDALAISVDGRFLIWTESGLFEPWQSGESSAPLLFAWSPDGSAIAIGIEGLGATRDDSGAPIDLVFADGSPDRRLPVSAAEEGMAWSLDGSRLAIGYQRFIPGIGASQRRLAFIALDEGTVTQIPSEHVTRPIGWPDAETLLVGEATGPLFAIPITSPADRSMWIDEPVFNSLAIGFSAAAPDLSRVASVRSLNDGPYELVVRDVPGGRERVLASVVLPDGNFSSGAWSPDSASVAVALYGESDSAQSGLWIFHVDGTAPRLVTNARLDLGYIRLGLSERAWRPAWPDAP